MEYNSYKTSKKTLFLIIAISVVLVSLLCITACSGNGDDESSVIPPVSEVESVPEVSEEISEEISEEVSEEISEEVSEEVSEEISVEPTEEELKIAETMPLYEKNPDLWGWLTIADTVVDYGVMYTPDNPNKYLRHDFDGNYSSAGMLLLDARCNISPESENLMIHGHNMNNGTMFRILHSYPDKEFYEAHRIVKLYIGEEVREYEIYSVFYDKVYYVTDTNFRFYRWLEIDNEEIFNEGINYYISKSVIDTGITPEYGDRLLTLVTCSYHVDYGRLIVAAREVKPAAETSDVTE